MRRIRTFIDYLLADTGIDSEHQSHHPSSIYLKIIYPVALNPLNTKRREAYYKFGYRHNRYHMR